MRRLLTALLGLLVLAACKRESYDSGDGELSYMRADFVEAHSVTDRKIDYVITDDGDKVTFSSPLSCSWASRSDSMYRALIYYNLVEGTGEASPIAISTVPVLTFGLPSDTVKIVTDPVTFESAWLSGSGKYLNLGVALKTGLAEGVDTRQVIGVVCESVDTLATGNHVFHLIFYHAQNDVPEYYSSRTYVSIPTAGMRNGDRIIISVNSYSGLVTKEFTVSRQ